MKPVILVTMDRRQPEEPHRGPLIRPPRAECWVPEAYIDAIRAAGGHPLLFPAQRTELVSSLRWVFELVDGVLLTGGHFDIHPALYGEAVTDRLDRVEPGRTATELELVRHCLALKVPLLGVCGGMQVMAVAAGGSLIQDLPLDPRHEQPTDPASPWHSVSIEPPVTQWLGTMVEVNSTHHQAVREPGSPFVACGGSPDGVVEVIAAPAHPFAVGVQWHPELLGDYRLYQALVRASARRRRSRFPMVRGGE